MTSSIPNGFSYEELENMLESAKPESVDPDTCTRKELYEIANKHLDAATEELKDPAVHGVMCELIILHMIEWHKHVALKLLEAGETDAAAAWMRDAGKFQAMANILDTVCFGENDPRNCD